MSYFTEDTFKFFRALARNNNRDWFNDNKQRYLDHVRDPFLAFIRDLDPKLREISSHYRASDKANGGSLFRIYRDTRFSKDKTPYKTWAGARFFHADVGKRGGPVYYLHLQPGNVFLGAGMWHPPTPITQQVRSFLQNNPRAWTRAVSDPGFKRKFRLAGDSLKRTPRGFDPDHPLADDIRRKDFIVISEFTDAQALSSRFLNLYVRRCAAASDFMDYLCAALDLEF